MDEPFTKAVIRVALIFAVIWDRKNTVRDYISPIEGAKTFEAYVWGNTQDGSTATDR